MRLTKSRIWKFQNLIFDWWELNKRDLPWRYTHNPYNIFISEIMLQQTQVSRVIPKYEEFLYFFPDVYTLAQASPAQVLKVWKGMGYNRRALYLHKTAKIIVEEYYGEFPEDEKKLTELPGLGTYTVRALLVFAFEKNVAAVDTNIRQIITHFFFHDVEQKSAVIQAVADKLMPIDQSWVMDVLRETNMKEIDIQKIMQKSKKYISIIISGLIKDGLVERKNGKLQLPD